MASITTSQLLPGEHLLWKGQPSMGLILRPIEALLIPFSILWGGFAIFWNASVWTTDAPFFFKLFGLPFLLAGAYITIGRFLIDMRLRGRLVYLVTDRRIVIAKNARGASVRSVDIRRLPALELSERPDGSGTIRFGSGGNWFSGNNFGIWQPTFDSTPQFIHIPHVRQVYELIHRQASG